MKLTTKIIIALAALSVAACFLLPILLGALAKNRARNSEIQVGPIKTIVIHGFYDSGRIGNLSCVIEPDEHPSANLLVKWPNTGDVDIRYSEADSTLTVKATGEPTDALVHIKANNELQVIDINGAGTVGILDMELPMLKINATGCRAYIDGGNYGALFTILGKDARLKVEGFEEDNDNRIDTLFYRMDGKKLTLDSDVRIGVLAALPGSAAYVPDGDDDAADISVMLMPDGEKVDMKQK